MDPLLELPAEIILKVIHSIDDFASVENFLIAYPHASDLFRSTPFSLLRSLCYSNPMTSSPEIMKLVSSMAIIRNPAANPSSLEDFSHLGLDNPLAYEHIANPDIAHEILHIAAQIQRLARTCLTKLRENLMNAMETYQNDHSSRATRIHDKSGNFDWVEEYRVHWALWHLHHYADLRKVSDSRAQAQSGTEYCSTITNWAEQIVNNYLDQNEIDLFMAETIWSVASQLVDLGFNWSGLLSSSKESQGDWLGEAAWEFPAEKSIPFFPSLEHDTNKNQSCCILWSPPEHESAKQEPSAPGMRPQLLSSPHMRFFRSRGRQKLSGGFGSLSSRVMIDVMPYRRLGVFLWSNKRMFSVGLLARLVTEEDGTSLIDMQGHPSQEQSSLAYRSMNEELCIYSSECLISWLKLSSNTLRC